MLLQRLVGIGGQPFHSLQRRLYNSGTIRKCDLFTSTNNCKKFESVLFRGKVGTFFPNITTTSIQKAAAAATGSKRTLSLAIGAALSLASSSLLTHMTSTTFTNCASSNSSNSNNNDGDDSALNNLNNFNIQKLGMAAGIGAVPGFCAGFMLRKLGNVAIFFAGSTFCVFQIAAYNGYVTIHWETVEKDLQSLMKSKEVGDIMNPENAEQTVSDVVDILTPNTKNGAMGGFGVGFLAGLKLG
jgi:uncharacterized membrane protein (Fun14 family)